MEKVWSDFKKGDRIKTDSITMTETHIVIFGSLSGDTYGLHMDEEFARKTPLKGRVAHVLLTLAMADGLFVRTGYVGNAATALLGMDNVRLHKYVRPGETITAEVEVTDARRTNSRDTGEVTLGFRVFNQRNELCLTFDFNLEMRKRLP